MKKKNHNLKDRTISFILVLVMVLSMLPTSGITAYAEEVTNTAYVASGEEEAAAYELSQDEDGYYLIANADDLYAFAEMVNSGALLCLRYRHQRSQRSTYLGRKQLLFQ